MKRTKKTAISLLMMFALLLSMAMPSWAADNLMVSLSADQQTVEKGDTVTISLSVPNYDTKDAFIGISGSLMYDASSFEFVDVAGADHIAAGNIDYNVLDGEIAVLYFNNNAFTAENPVELTEGGKILDVTFKAITEEAKAEFSFNVSEIASLADGVVEPAGADAASAKGVTVSVGNATVPGDDSSNPSQGNKPAGNPSTGDASLFEISLVLLAVIVSGAVVLVSVSKAKGVPVRVLLKKMFNRKSVISMVALVLVTSIAMQSGAMLKADALITEQDFYTYSDANGDGVVDTTDRDLIRQTLVKKDVIAPENFNAANAYTADEKDAITMMDLAIALQRIDGIIYDVGNEDIYSQPSDVYYEVFVRAFYDSDGDGIGDLQGLASKIPYLASLGITGIWMMPINQNNSSHGYDTIDYYAVEEDYGTMEDFEYLADVAHEYGIDLVMDLVINHCSSQNVWFQEALKGETLEDGTHNKYYDYFYFLPPDANIVDKTDAEIKAEKAAYLKEHGSLDGWVEQYPKLDNATDNNAPITGASSSGVWRQVRNESSPLNGYYYMAIFGGMVDLNLTNPEVRQECIDIANFWLDKGMDGFRLDACRHIYGKYYSTIHTEEVFAQNKAWWQEFTAAVTADHPDAYLIGEVWEQNTENMVPFIEEGGLQSVFNFNLASKLLAAAGNESTYYNDADYDESLTNPDSEDLNIVSDLVDFYQRFGEASGGNFVDCTFLSNHDKNRVFSVLEGNMDHCRTAATMLLTLPGNPYLYYGEEVGLAGAKPDTNIREPMPWYINPYQTNEDGSLATTGSGWSQYPIAIGEGMSTWTLPKYSLGGIYSVEAQINDPTSLYSHYEELINARTNIPALKDGGIGEYDLGGQNILSFVRVTDTQRVLVAINLTGQTVTETVTPSDSYGQFIRTVFKSTNDCVSNFDGETVTIAPYSVIVLE